MRRPRNRETSTKVCRTRRKSKGCIHRQFSGIRRTCKDAQWNHSTSSLSRPETNGIAERAVRRVAAVSSSILLPYGLDEQWWAESVDCCHLQRPTSFVRQENSTCTARVRTFQWNILRFQRKTRRGSISPTRELYQESLWVMLVRREAGKETYTVYRLRRTLSGLGGPKNFIY